MRVGNKTKLTKLFRNPKQDVLSSWHLNDFVQQSMIEAANNLGIDDLLQV